MGKWLMCVCLCVWWWWWWDYTDTHLHRVRHSMLSQFPDLTLDVSGMQHSALCTLEFINASSFVSSSSHSSRAAHTHLRPCSVFIY